MSPERKGRPSIEELRAAQTERDTQVAEEKADEETRIAEEGRLQEQAGEDIKIRPEVLAGLKESQAEHDEMIAEGIEGRIASADRIKLGREAKEVELGKTEERLETLSEYLQELEDLVLGKADEAIVEGIKEALESARADHGKVQGEMSQFRSEIADLEGQEVGDDEVERFRGVKERIEGLNQQMIEIESNDAVNEILFREAETEDAIRDQVIRQTLIAAGDSGLSETQKGLGKSIAQRFLGEELQARGIDGLEGVRELAEGMVIGLKRSNVDPVAGEQDTQKRSYISAGVSLRNLVGAHGTLEGTISFLSAIESDPSSDPYATRTISDGGLLTEKAILRHLSTLNLLKAQTAVLDNMPSPVAKEFRLGPQLSDNNMWSQVLLRASFRSQSSEIDGPIIPQDATEADSTKIATQFEKDRVRIEEQARELTQEVGTSLRQRQTTMTARVAELSEQKAEVESIHKENGKIGKPKQVEAEIETLEQRKAKFTQEKSDFESELSGLGLFKGKRKKLLTGNIAFNTREIGGLDEQIETAQGNLAKLKENSARVEEIGKQPHELESELAELRQKLAKVDRDIEALEQSKQ